MVAFDLRSGVCYTAATPAGRSAAALCSVLGAFNSESTEGHFLGHPDRQASCCAATSFALRAVLARTSIPLSILLSDASILLAAGLRGQREGAAVLGV